MRYLTGYPLGRGKPTRNADPSGAIFFLAGVNCRLASWTLLRHQFKRSIGLATERTVTRKFQDCIRGAVAALDPAYDLETISEDSLMGASELYFEAGDTNI
jgi:prolyl-tRNA editing enzyme YbaK/EbsC (Cys-tRNA(Pro) deacylase)